MKTPLPTVNNLEDQHFVTFCLILDFAFLSWFSLLAFASDLHDA